MKSKKSFITAAALVLGLTSASYMSGIKPLQTNAATTAPGVNAEKSLLEERVALLEKAIAPTSADTAITTWAEAVKNRNGALQYALFTENTRLGMKRSLEQFHWVTGASSPWVDSYKVISKKVNKDQTIEYVIEFDLAMSTGYAGKDRAKLTLVKSDGNWFIRDLGPLDEKAVGIWNTPESIHEPNLEMNLKEIKNYESKLGYKLQLLNKDMAKLSIKEGTSKNEEGNPPSTHFYYKDSKLKKEILLMSIIRVTDKQASSKYYKDHPFLQKISSGKGVSYYAVFPSEHPYGKNENSQQGKEWANLKDVLKERSTKILILSE